jgi:hypothetical protein
MTVKNRDMVLFILHVLHIDSLLATVNMTKNLFMAYCKKSGRLSLGKKDFDLTKYLF